MQTSHDSETPAAGKQVITACMLLHQKIAGVEKVFLPKRAETKKFLPGVYELPGGHIEFGEDLIAGLKREIKEELSLEIVVGDPFYAFTYNNPIKGSHSVEIVYFASLVDPNTKILLNPEDHSDYIWVGLEDLDRITHPAKGKNDPEYLAIKKGLELLAGAKPIF